MTGQQQFILVFTFVVGVVIGMYFYVTSYAPTVANAPIGQTKDVKFVIEGEAYGGCAFSGDRCPSFQLSSNGAYRYLPNPDAPLVEGTLPARLRNELLTKLERRDVAALSAAVPNSQCASYADGIDFSYLIRTASDRYELDTCGTALAQDLELRRDLQGIWDYMAEPETVYPIILEAGLSGYLEHRFQQGS